MKTTQPTTIFDLVNNGNRGLRLILEPEGAEFLLAPGETLQIQIFGSDMPLALKHSVDENGQSALAFWPDKGDYELIFKGKRLWDLMK